MRRLFAVMVFAVLCVTALPAPLRAADATAAASPALDAARAKVAAGDSAGALRDLSVYVPSNPADADAARFLGDLYFRVPDYRKAEATWRAIIARVPDDRQTHNRLGSLYAAQDRIADAIIEYEKSLPSRGGFLGLVDEHRRQGDLAQFVAEFERNADDAPLDPRAQSFYGSVLRAERNFVQAQHYFERAADLAPRNCGVLVDAGNNLIDLSRLDDAARFLNRCLAIDANNYAANVDLGEALVEQNQDVKARPYFDRALQTKPDGSEALVDVGYLEDDSGQWKSAVNYYLRAMNAYPLESAAYIDLGYDYNAHQLYNLAEAAFIKGLSVAPDDGRLHYMLAVTYNVQGKVSLARDQYERAIASKEPLVVHAAQAELALLPAR
jgi:tetratricopeptide (TPR) repeat protein